MELQTTVKGVSRSNHALLCGVPIGAAVPLKITRHSLDSRARLSVSEKREKGPGLARAKPPTGTNRVVLVNLGAQAIA